MPLLHTLPSRPAFAALVVLGVMTTRLTHGQEAKFDAPIAKTSTVPSEPGKSVTRALLITGGCCHDYQNQKQIITEGLSQQFPNIAWTIVQYSDGRDVRADVYRRGNWINDFDIVIHNECFGGVTDGEFVRGIVDAHRRTKIPAIVVHCSMHSYRNAPTADVWREFLGVTSRRHEKVKRSLSVVASTESGKHPIVEPIAGKPWQTPNGELYIIEKVWPGTTVLATASSKETGKDEPVIWVNQFDGVKVFGISLGHHNETMQSDPWQAIVANGWQWAMAD